ncbi:hypothetical protein [Amycolatopsis sp. GM8]|uniref:hypothetical protein n=1 Tax=Amycolatopsis sp. GM8 TaxID=2896530 RepID=UPI001F3002BE|nr:hypothetical protein [Amycolatopsis sp. GM8]
MRNARIAGRDAAEALSLLLDEDIATVAEEDAVAAEVAEIDALVRMELGEEAAVLDAVIEQAERTWAGVDQLESFRLSRNLTDPVRVRRGARRAGRVVLRSLPVRLDVLGGEAA